MDVLQQPRAKDGVISLVPCRACFLSSDHRFCTTLSSRCGEEAVEGYIGSGNVFPLCFHSNSRRNEPMLLDRLDNAASESNCMLDR